MPHGLLRALRSRNPTRHSHIERLTPLFYAHIGAGHQDRKLLSCKHIVISVLWPCWH